MLGSPPLSTDRRNDRPESPPRVQAAQKFDVTITIDNAYALYLGDTISAASGAFNTANTAASDSRTLPV